MTLAAEIAQLARAGAPELTARYLELFGKSPRRRNPAWLRKRIAFRLQENAFGGLSRTARAAIDKLGSEITLPAAPSGESEPLRAGELRVGAVLQREWHGQLIRVEAIANGFEWNGVRYDSLTAV